MNENEIEFEKLITEGSHFVVVPNFIDELSEIVGRLREGTNKDLITLYPEFARGSYEEKVNPLGIKGELIAQHILSSKGIEYESAPLYAAKPVACPDIIIGKYKIDSKGVRSDGWDLLVNKGAHEKRIKDITHYFFSRKNGTGARYWIHSHKEVSSWMVKPVRYSLAYYKRI